MKDSIAATASSLRALSEQYQAIAHNLANANTAGYKRQVTAFSAALQRQLAGGAPAGGADLVRPVTGIDFSQAALNVTGRSLDLALAGDGFFVLETAEGPRYTRNGSFVTDDQGRLTDMSGRTVAGDGGPLTIPPNVGVTDIHVSNDGNISAGGQNIGRLQIVRFEDTSVLEPVGSNAFRAPEGAAASPAADTVVHQGATESSNVNTVEALVGLITVTRMYEANLRSIAAQNERAKRLMQVAMS
ncbi:MAG: flagellar basal-body rod protein FlgF [Phycisphaerae bacterium]